MKLGTHVLPEVLNQIISNLLAQPTKKASYRDFSKKNLKNGLLLNALRYQLGFRYTHLSYQYALQQELSLKSDDANRPNQPTSQKPIKMDNFYKNCPIWLRFGMQLSFTPLYHQEKF